MPLSSNGLCEAEITTPASKSARARQVRDGRRRHDARRSSTVAPSPRAPCASSASIQAPDSRVSRPMSRRGGAADVRQRAHERRAEPPHGGVIERDSARPCRERRRCRTAVLSADVSALPLLMLTCTVAGSMRATPTRRGGIDAHGQRVPARRPRPARSTDAARRPGRRWSARPATPSQPPRRPTRRRRRRAAQAAPEVRRMRPARPSTCARSAPAGCSTVDLRRSRHLAGAAPSPRTADGHDVAHRRASRRPPTPARSTASVSRAHRALRARPPPRSPARRRPSPTT